MPPPVLPRRSHTTVELALGRRWWLLPTVVALPPVVVRLLVELLRPVIGPLHRDGTEFLIVLMLWVMPASVVAATHTAAVLNGRGARLKQRSAGLGVILSYSLALSFPVPMRGVVHFFTIFALVQLASLMIFRWPRWRLQSDDQPRRGVSIRFLLTLTAVVAIVVASGSEATIFHWVLNLSMAAAVTALALSGQFTSCMADRSTSKMYGVVFAMAFVLSSLGIALASLDVALASLAILGGLTYLFTSIVLPTWAICYFHRCDRKQPTAATDPPVR